MKRWPLNRAYFWETAPFFRILLPFAAGIFAYDRNWFAGIASPAVLAVMAVAFLLFIVAGSKKKSGGFFSYLVFALVNLILFCGGLATSQLYDVRNDRKWFGNNINTAQGYLVQVTDNPTEKEQSWKVPVQVVAAADSGEMTEATGAALIYLYKDSLLVALHKGDSIWVPGKWQQVKNAGNPFEFDYATYCRRSNIFHRQFCTAEDISVHGRAAPADISFTDRAHNWCMGQLDKHIPDHKTKGLIQAMLLGDERSLEEGIRLAYSETGIIHIIAISGGNVAIFFIVISALLWWLKHKKHAWIKFAIALPLVWFYVLMAGAPPSAVRAAIMFSLLAAGVMLQKNNNSLNQLFATAFLLLCAQPMWLFSVGFQLSFTAVLSLILFYAPVYRLVSPRHKTTRALWGAVTASLAAEVLVAPLVVYYFHTFPLMFLVANVAAYLFMGVVLMLGIVIIALFFLPAAASVVGICTIWLVAVFDRIVAWLQGLNPESFHFLVLTGVELALLYASIAGVAIFLLKKRKAALFTGLCALCLLMTSFCSDEWCRLHQRRLVAYNVAGTNQIELINGSGFSEIVTDTSRQKKINYAVKEAHINWRSWKKTAGDANELFEVGGKTVLVLMKDIHTSQHFPVDYLVINTWPRPNIAKLRKIFSPAAIVIGNTYSRRQQERMVRTYGSMGITIHSIGNGALVVD